MLKITTNTAGDERLTISIVGRLTRQGCDAIDEVLQDRRNREPSVTLDLTGVTLVDRFSVEYLANLRRRHIALINLPAYVNRWIEQVSNPPESDMLN